MDARYVNVNMSFIGMSRSSTLEMSSVFKQYFMSSISWQFWDIHIPLWYGISLDNFISYRKVEDLFLTSELKNPIQLSFVINRFHNARLVGSEVALLPSSCWDRGSIAGRGGFFWRPICSWNGRLSHFLSFLSNLFRDDIMTSAAKVSLSNLEIKSQSFKQKVLSAIYVAIITRRYPMAIYWRTILSGK